MTSRAAPSGGDTVQRGAQPGVRAAGSRGGRADYRRGGVLRPTRPRCRRAGSAPLSQVLLPGPPAALWVRRLAWRRVTRAECGCAESMVELQDSLSTENSEDENTTNRAYVPSGVGVTVQVCGVTTRTPPAPGRLCSARVAAGCPPRRAADRRARAANRRRAAQSFGCRDGERPHGRRRSPGYQWGACER